MATAGYVQREALAHTGNVADAVELAAFGLEGLLSRSSAVEAVEAVGMTLADLYAMQSVLATVGEKLDAACAQLDPDGEYVQDDRSAVALDLLATTMDATAANVDPDELPQMRDGLGQWADRIRSAAALRRAGVDIDCDD